MSNPTSGNLVDEFEEAFQSCLEVCTQDEAVNEINKDEIRGEVEQTIAKFIDLARQMEAFFLQKRFMLSALKPEFIIKEDINDLRSELIRKDDLIKRHYDKINVWQNMLADLQGYPKSPANQQIPSNIAIPGGTVVGGSSVGGGGGGIIGPGNDPNQQAPPNQMSVSLVQQQQQQQQQQQLVLQQQQQQQLQMQQQQSQQNALFLAHRNSYGSLDGPNTVQLQGPLAYLEKTASSIDGPR